MTDPKVIAGLTAAQKAIVRNPVRGVISGLFFVSDSASALDELNALGLCAQRFEPSDFASRGHRHAARMLPAGREVQALLNEDRT